MKRRGLSLAVGALLLAVAVGFCVDTFLDERARVSDALGSASIGWLVVAVLVAGFTMAWLAWRWSACLSLLGADRPVGTVARWYFVGELGKYVPGGIWPVVGRGELARRGGVDRSVAYQSVVWSLAGWYGASVLPLAAAATHPRLQSAAARLAGRASGGRLVLTTLPWATAVRLVASYLPTWLCIAGASAAVTHAYGTDPGWQAPAAAVLAWVVGFLAVPVPAGAGVREAVFVASSGLDGGVALTVAVTTRLAFVLVDLTGAALAAVTMPRRATIGPA